MAVRRRGGGRGAGAQGHRGAGAQGRRGTGAQGRRTRQREGKYGRMEERVGREGSMEAVEKETNGSGDARRLAPAGRRSDQAANAQSSCSSKAVQRRRRRLTQTDVLGSGRSPMSPDPLYSTMYQTQCTSKYCEEFKSRLNGLKTWSVASKFNRFDFTLVCTPLPRYIQQGCACHACRDSHSRLPAPSASGTAPRRLDVRRTK